MEDPYRLGLKDHTPPVKETLDTHILQACFEWADGNEDAEDRNGLFVTLNKENKLVIGGKGKIVGITTDSQPFDPAMQWVNYSGIGTSHTGEAETKAWVSENSFGKICRKTGKVVRKSTFPSRKDIVRILGTQIRDSSVKVKVMW
jgi:hypothetical protein